MSRHKPRTLSRTRTEMTSRSQCITSRGTLGQPIPPLVMLTLIIWPNWCLPGFSTDNSSCFHCLGLQSCGTLFQSDTNILILMKPPPTALSIHDNSCLYRQLWLASGEHVFPSPPTMTTWHSTIRKSFPTAPQLTHLFLCVFIDSSTYNSMSSRIPILFNRG